MSSAILLWGRKPSLLSFTGPGETLDTVSSSYVEIRSPTPATIVFKAPSKNLYALSIGPWEAPVPAELVRGEAIAPPKTRPRTTIAMSTIRRVVDYMLARMEELASGGKGLFRHDTRTLLRGERFTLDTSYPRGGLPEATLRYSRTIVDGVRVYTLSARIKLDVLSWRPVSADFEVRREHYYTVLHYRVEAAAAGTGETPDLVITATPTRILLDEEPPVPRGLEASSVRARIHRASELAALAEKLEPGERLASRHSHRASGWEALPSIHPEWLDALETGTRVVYTGEGRRLPASGAEASLYTGEPPLPSPPRVYTLSRTRARSLRLGNTLYIEIPGARHEILMPAETLEPSGGLTEILEEEGFEVTIDEKGLAAARPGEAEIRISREPAPEDALHRASLEALAPGEEEPSFSLGLLEPSPNYSYKVSVKATELLAARLAGLLERLLPELL